MTEKSSGCCCGAGGCCAPQSKEKNVHIDFLYLDLDVCARCQGTEKNLDEAVREVSGVLRSAGYEVTVNKVNIASKELAEEYRFLSSPTIRVNGKDIAPEVKENCCTDCGDLCGDKVDCRVWSFNGVDYTEPPKALLVNAILKEVYSDEKDTKTDTREYSLPHNLAVFFAGREKR